MKKCLNISEEVVLPEIHEIEEHLVMTPPVQCEETVNIPAIVQKPKFIPDPSWGNLDECPDNHIWMIVYSNDPQEYDIGLKPYRLRLGDHLYWGDGEVLTFTELTPQFFYEHKYIKGTGKLDSNGNEFWLIDIEAGFDSNREFAGYSRVEIDTTDNIISYIHAIVCGKNTVYIQQAEANWYIPYIKVKGDFIQRTPNIFVNAPTICEYDSGVTMNKIVNPFFPNGVDLRISDVFDRGLKAKYLSSLNIDSKSIPFENIIDLSKFELINPLDINPTDNISIQGLVRGFNIREVILPNFHDDVSYNIIQLCSRLYNCKKIIFPVGCSLRSFKTFQYAFYYNYVLEVLENFPFESAGMDADKVDCSYMFTLCGYKGECNMVNTKMSRFSSEGNSNIIVGLSGLKFHKNSPFDQSMNGVNIDIKYNSFPKNKLVELFIDLPNFTGSNSRSINISNNPGTSELTEEDIKIATDKNWRVIGV